MTAIQRTKQDPNILGRGSRTLHDIFNDKGYQTRAVQGTARDFIAMVLRERVSTYSRPRSYYDSGAVVDHPQLRAVGRAIETYANQGYSPFSYYRGSASENLDIDRALKLGGDRGSPLRKVAGEGATRMFRKLNGVTSPPPSSGRVVILGAGAAGIVAARALISMNFHQRDITLIDKQGEFNGIWNQENVKGLSKNNPFEISWGPGLLKHVGTTPAPGSGQTITKFLTRLAEVYPRVPEPLKGKVLSIAPGDLNHTVLWQDAKGEERTLKAKILINCLGNGKPLEPNHSEHMLFTGQGHGIRWQQIITPEQAKGLEGKTLVFIGLGNSTAEMMVQIEKYRAQGINIQYRVLTHYSLESILNPNKELFRNIRIPNLTKLEGDLPEVRAAYWRAIAFNWIIPGVFKYHHDPDLKRITYHDRNSGPQTIPCDQLYTLIGYGHDPVELKNWGMTVTDNYRGEIAYDYDGEIQRIPGRYGRQRVWPGYFALGAILRTQSNPNAVVLPGIIHRSYDLAYSAYIRANETRPL